MKTMSLLWLFAMAPLMGSAAPLDPAAVSAPVTADTCEFSRDFSVARDYACVARNFSRYMTRADAGDSTAATILYFALAGCGQDELTRAQAGLASLRPKTDQDSRNFARILGKNVDKCAHFDTSQVAEYGHIRSLPANSDQEDQRALRNAYLAVSAAMQRAPTDPENHAQAQQLIERLKENADGDHATNLQMLASIYEQGVIAPKDLVAAYAYAAASVAVEQPANSIGNVYLLNKLDSIGAQLSVAQKAAALKTASTLSEKPTPLNSSASGEGK